MDPDVWYRLDAGESTEQHAGDGPEWHDVFGPSGGSLTMSRIRPSAGIIRPREYRNILLLHVTFGDVHMRDNH